RGPLSSKKQRKEPHVEGRWPVLVHIPLPSASVAEIDAATEPLLPCLSSEHTHTWHSTGGEFSSASMHVSLSRVLYVWEAALPDFTQRVAAALGEPGGQRQFTAALQGGRILPGEGGASSFLAATFTPHAAACVGKLIAAVDEVCRACGQPSYHTVRQDPLPHVSVAWAQGDACKLWPGPGSSVTAPAGHAQSQALVTYSSSSSSDHEGEKCEQDSRGAVASGTLQAAVGCWEAAVADISWTVREVAIRVGRHTKKRVQLPA
ncbi:unnamed protein product, partial [Symbiodinium sp. KB8]